MFKTMYVRTVRQSRMVVFLLAGFNCSTLAILAN